MTRTVFILVMAAATSGLFANDIAVAEMGGGKIWLLLEAPYGDGGPGLGEFAGDPGMPVPDALNWPGGAYPQTDLWRFERGKYTRATNVLSTDTRATFKRTLYSVFMINEQPYVLHYDPYSTLKQGTTQVLRVDDATANAGGTPPAESIVFGSADFMDAPAANPDGTRVVFRAFKLEGGKFKITLRVYTTADWKLEAESEAHTFCRPVWVDDSALAVIAYDADKLPDAPQRDANFKFSVRITESHTPQPGKLLRLDLADGKLNSSEILTGSFPPDRYTRTLLFYFSKQKLLLARAEGEGVVAEVREPKAGGEFHEIARYEAWRGCALSLWSEVECAGVRTVDRAKTLVLTRYSGKLDEEPKEFAIPDISAEAHGGMIAIGYELKGFLEPVVNPEYEPGTNETAELLRHTLWVATTGKGPDTMRNPRVLQKLSKLVRRFAEIGNVRSSLLAFDVEISANEGRNEKKGRYIELYSAGGRKGHGAIRIEDNLSGTWLVQSIDGGGEPATDDYYSWAGQDPKNPPKMDGKKATDAGKAYHDLITQLEARKLLMLGGVENDWSTGGLTFLGRDSYRDPTSGATWRVWVFEKLGDVIDAEAYRTAEAEIEALRGKLLKLEGEELEKAERELVSKVRSLKKMRERIEIRFVADLPIGSAGKWEFPHAIAQVQMKFALSNTQKAAVTELTFEPDKFVALPNLVDAANPGKKRPDLLLPKVFRIYGRNAAGQQIEELKATALPADKALEHPATLVKGGKLTPGYEVPGASLGNKQFTELKR